MSESTVTANKISSAQLMAALDRLTESMTTLSLLQALSLKPQPIVIYKPQATGKGAAARFDLRLIPEWNHEGYVKRTDGGCFLEVVPQIGTDEDGNATFGWQDPDLKVIAKLGLPDITAFLTAFRCRWYQRELPESLRKKGKDGTLSPNTISLFHKFGDGSTVIEYTMLKDGGILGVSSKRGEKVSRGSIKVSIPEELLIESHLSHALEMFRRVGKR